LSKTAPLLWLPLILWTVVIGFLSFSTIPTAIVPEFKAADKLAHFGMYALVEVFIYLPLRNNKTAFKIFTLLAISFAALTEVVQHFAITSRTGEVYDFIANLIGIIVVYIYFINKIKT